MATVPQNSVNMQLQTRDTNDTNILNIVWNENDTSDRTLNIEVNGDNRTIDLTGNLTVEAAAIVDQDLSTDATDVDFGSLQLGGAGATVDEFSTDGTMAGNSDTAVPTEKAVKTYVGTATAGVLAWNSITGNTSAAVNNGYITNSEGTWEVTLPATAAVGSIVEVVGGTSTGWKLIAAAGDTIQFGDLITKAAGSLASKNQHDCVRVVCTAADTSWKVTTGSTLDVEVS